MKKNKGKKLSNFIFINYFVLFVILILSVWLTYTVTTWSVDKVEMTLEKEYYMEEVYGEYKEGGITNFMEAFKEKYGLEIAFIEHLNGDNKVINAYNSENRIGYQYDYYDIDELINEPENKVFYPPNEMTIDYDYDMGTEDTDMEAGYDDLEADFTNEYFIYRIDTSAVDKQVSNIMIATVAIYSIFLLLVISLFTKIMSKTIVKPVEVLTRAVKGIGDGNYNVFVDFESKNELGVLKESIIKMSATIDEEIKLREKSEKDRQELILNISHDLKTPLTNIRGYSETIIDVYDNLDNELLKYMKIIQSNSVKADVLLKDLFELSKLNSSNLKLNFKEMNLSEVLRRIIIDYVPELDDKGISYEIDIPQEKVIKPINEESFRRAICNIINNSIRFVSPQKGSRIDVKMSWDGESASIVITDNGPGIKSDKAADIFKPFVTVDESRTKNMEGSGLGLSITKSIIEKHDGTVVFDLAYKGGVKFIITL